MELIRHVTPDGVVVLELTGRMDNAAGTALCAAAEPDLRAGAGIVLDATAVEAVTDAGVRLLNTLAHRAQQRGATAVVAGFTPDVRAALAATGWLSRLTVAADLATAVRMVSRTAPTPAAGGARA